MINCISPDELFINYLDHGFHWTNNAQGYSLESLPFSDLQEKQIPFKLMHTSIKLMHINLTEEE